MEEAGTLLAGILLVLAVIATVVAFVIFFMREVLGLTGLSGHSITPLPNVDRVLLEQWNPFYRNLDPRSRKRFARRVKEIMFEKEWIGKGITVTREMRVRIAGAAAQVTFGFDRLLLPHFSHILIFPGEYVNKRTGHRHLGEVMPKRGTIVLSWEHFQEGYAAPSDAHNVGLHEMAHALWFENEIENGEDDFLRPDLLGYWCALADVEITRIKNGEDHFFRDYAGTNQEEFFAVAVEYFFERPVEFKAALPSLYGSLAGLLKQDTAGS